MINFSTFDPENKKTIMSHSIKPGVATGREVQEIFKLAKEKGFALPAVNVIGSNTINGVLETAKALNAPVIIQFSNGGAQFNAEKGFQMKIKKLLLPDLLLEQKHVSSNGRSLWRSCNSSYRPLCKKIITLDYVVCLKQVKNILLNWKNLYNSP